MIPLPTIEGGWRCAGNVRGLLCHRCNIVIGGFDDAEFRDTALAWLDRGRA